MKPDAKWAALFAACTSTATITAPAAPPEPPVSRCAGLASKKGPAVDEPPSPPLLATLDQVHTGEHVVLDSVSPALGRFEALLADRVTGARHAIDDRLLGLLRALAARHPGARIEIVSGFRSPKFNEMLRKKGHHVASHSQHSLGHACDFRIVTPDEDAPLEPREVEREIRDLGWSGGVGVYPTKDDRFVHADVGPNRSWTN
ncbi:MAG TPA: DUF882 domain-containing protein [Polyangiaceae bacterium]|nr:DUF882 domain-containing protein [Polyangiaceae bacterium]